MRPSLQITYLNVDNSPTLDMQIRERLDHLSRLCPAVERCEIVIEHPHSHVRHNDNYAVRIHVGVPGTTIIANRHCAGDAYIAVRDGFDAIRHQIEEHHQRLLARQRHSETQDFD